MTAVAESRMERCPVGRLVCVVRHAPLPGVSREMMAWWFANQDALIMDDDGEFPAIRLWHPTATVHYLNPNRRQPGSRRRETVVGQTRTTTVLQLDDRGFTRSTFWAGLEIARLVHTFVQTPEGAVCHSTLTVGLSRGPWRWLVNRVLRPLRFGRARAAEWMTDIERSVSTLPSFLPELWRARARTPVPVTVLGVQPRRSSGRRAG